MPIQQLTGELNKLIIRKFEKRKVRSSFIDSILGTDLADIQSTSKFNKGIGFFLCVIGNFGKFVWAVSLKDKKGIITANAFQKKFKWV